MDFASIVREERTSKGLTQGELAERAGLSLHAVWEAERGNGSVAVLAALVSALDIRFAAAGTGETWGARVRALRTKRGWSQEKLAARAGVSPMAINRLENGNARIATLSAALRVLAPRARARKPQIANWGDGSRDERFTPQDVVRRIESVLNGIELDPCGHPKSPVRAERYIQKEEDGLKQPWNARTVFVNPPYSETGEFVRKAAQEWKSRRAGSILLLLPVKTGFKWFQDDIMGTADVFFLRGRIAFERLGMPATLAPFPIMLVLYGGTDVMITRIMALFECGHMPTSIVVSRARIAGWAKASAAEASVVAPLAFPVPPLNETGDEGEYEVEAQRQDAGRNSHRENCNGHDEPNREHDHAEHADGEARHDRPRSRRSRSKMASIR
ncbi:DNA N-6-adenine-methyltransferase [Salinarimonas ramus]|uniref:HTH cro/C1-type domain-containing protein n=1 Tax=Salinarimonas ramus TaxID=690164 RepID=A0A917QDY0_9HYPH|nr:DNA N-6-adenine-methyltransferase [Salinarimonas ramus]GGK46116.1 hypothetical protein GCM10011322_36500 [Salinarimonas ramus]